MMARTLVPGDYTAIRASTINTHNSRCQPRVGRVGGGREVLKDETAICGHLEKRNIGTAGELKVPEFHSRSLCI